MKTINLKKVLLSALLALVTTSAVGCVVPYRPYYYDGYRRDDHYRRYDRDYRYDWRRYPYRWDRD